MSDAEKEAKRVARSTSKARAAKGGEPSKDQVIAERDKRMKAMGFRKIKGFVKSAQSS